MNTGIQILIERMKTNPEEWCKAETNTKMGKWESIVASFWDYLPEEDQAAYKAARHALLADEFTEEVMKKLAGVSGDDGVALSSKTLPPSVGTLRVNTNTNQYEIFDGNQWIVTNNAQQLNPSNPMYGQQAMAQQQYGAGGLGGDNSLYAGGGGGGSMLGNLAKNLGFK
jgi:hypothetical protein